MSAGKKRRVTEKWRAACRKNLEKAWAASRAHWEFTPARRAASERTIRLAQAAIRGKKRKLSPLQLQASRESMKKALAALQARGRTPEHLAKLRESIKKARAARTARSNALHSRAITQHGLYARNLMAAMDRLDEDPKDFAEFIVRTCEFLAPKNGAERQTAVQIAGALWRHHRIFYAQARWEIERVKKLLEERRAIGSEEAEEMRIQFYWLAATLDEQVLFHERQKKVRGALDRLLRRFLKLRFGEKHPLTKSLRPTRDETISLQQEIARRDPALAFVEQALRL